MQRLKGWGVGIPQEGVSKEAIVSELAVLGANWYFHWGDAPVTSPVTFAPMIWSSTYANTQRITDRMVANPGLTWLLFNEPERPEQANTSPEVAVEATRLFLNAAWASGTEFQWAAAGVAIGMDDHDGLDWLTRYMKLQRRSSGIRSANYWHVHGYRSPTVERFRRSWEAWLRWYDVWGVGAPVIMSEVCAEGAELSHQYAIMDEVARMLDSGELTAAAWFSSHVSAVSQWHNAALCTVDVAAQRVTLKPLGQHFVEFAS